MLSQILINIRRMSRSEDELLSELAHVLRISADSEQLDQLERQVETVVGADLKSRLASMLASAWATLLSGDATAAENYIGQITSAIPSPTPHFVAAIDIDQLQKSPGSLSHTKLSDILAWLSGSDNLDDGRFYLYARPILFVILLLLLSSVGLYNLYIKNPVFGSEGYFDYLGLLLWGISADVGQKTLQTLTMSRGG
jgi:hypothetical protein